ncbi:hypothetical protein [Canibacter zhoujuaniae]|uniref:hypothetical protein n=1 Tax=Canibacter zhoujuaniae TaxID=2708343 RepID=UPI00141F9434|nr:hypothetical protein [Canibacter zhoujuaniae]
MDLKFTFTQKPGTADQGLKKTAGHTANTRLGLPGSERQLPFNVNAGGASSELIVRITRNESAMLGVAVSGDGVEYARQSVDLRDAHYQHGALVDPKPIRSALSRVVAELGDKLLTAVQLVEVPVEASAALLEAELVTSDSTISATGQLRTGLPKGTPVKLI